MRTTLASIAIAATMATTAPAHAGVWDSLKSAVSSMFSRAGVSGYTAGYYGTPTMPRIITNLPPSRLQMARQGLWTSQRIRANAIDVDTYLLTGMKFMPPRGSMTMGPYTGPTTPCHGRGCNGG